jgi:hypothetical protein
LRRVHPLTPFPLAMNYDSIVSILPISALLSQPPLDHERFAAHKDLEARMKATVR